ncbi:hypothetical protein [uncultured Aquimarina sp.]|uniref:hypothetical protein n=1 Tax=uncultured Aquimarina sp. TaxID=575652 RepID=UPI002639060F|nr:hypothetical protein [uncultured Aquimarina sp.]
MTTLILFVSCKSNKELVEDIKEISYYTGNIRIDQNLSTSIIEGTLNYGDDLKETGGFEYYHHFYPDDKSLVWLQYSQATNTNLKENFFYKKNELVYAESYNSEYENDKKIIFLKNGKLIYENKSDFTNSEKLIRKGKQFLTEYKKSL